MSERLMDLFKKREFLPSSLFLAFLGFLFFLVGWPFCRLVLVFSFLFLLPGYLLTKIIFPRKSLSLFEMFPLSYCLGFSFLVIPGTLAYFLRPSLNTFTILYLLFILVFFVLFFRYRKKIINSSKTNDTGRLESSNLFLSVFVGIIILGSFILMLRMGSHFSGDAITHIGNARHFFHAGINPYDFITGDGIRVVYGFNIWHVALALLSNLSFLEPALTWFYLAALLTPLSLLAFFSLAKVLIRNEEAASVALVVHILLKLGGEGYERFLETHVGWLSLGQWTTLAYPFPHALYIFLPMALFLLWHFLDSQKNHFIWAMGLIVLAIPAIHPLGLFSLFWAILCFVIFSWIFDGKKEIRKFKKLIWGLIIIPAPYVLIKAVVYLQYRLSLGTSFSQTVSLAVKKHLSAFLIKVFGKFSYLDLNSILSIPKVAFGVSLALIFLFYFIKTHRGAKFLFSNVLFTLVARLNSVLSPLLIKTISLNLTIRSATRWLFYLGGLTTGWFLYEIFSIPPRLIFPKLRLASKHQKMVSQVFLFLVVIFLINGVIFLDFFAIMGISSKQAQDMLSSSFNLKRQAWSPGDRLSRFISENIPKGKVFLIDTEKNRSLQKSIAYNGNHVVSLLPRLGSAFMKVPPPERIIDVEKIISPGVSFEESIPLLDKYGINFLLISQNKKELLQKFKQKLENLYEDGEVIILKYK